MKWAKDADNNRIEAKKGLKGHCPGCGEEVTPKDGPVRINHWAHKVGTDCDPWWEPETQWHRDWKNCFPESWQEYTIKDDHGIRHRADVYNPSRGIVIEFQNSAISLDEVLERERFYKRMIWVLNSDSINYQFDELSNAARHEPRIKTKLKAKQRLRTLPDVEQKRLIQLNEELSAIHKEKNNQMQRLTKREIKESDWLEQDNKLDAKSHKLYAEIEVIKKQSSDWFNGELENFQSACHLKNNVNENRHKEERYVLNYWRRKSKCWEVSNSPIFIDIKSELVLIKDEHIGQLVPKAKFISKYSKLN